MEEKDYEQMFDNEVQGAENAVRKMLLYYISALDTVGVQDIKQYIATRISSMIDLSEEQYNFIKLNFESDNKIIENLENGVKLLKKIENEQKLDITSINIVKQMLETIIRDYKTSIT